MSDKNFVSIAGTPDGELWLVDFRKPPGQTNTKLREAGDTKWVDLFLGDIDPYAYPGWGGLTTDTLKVSGGLNLGIKAGRVVGGTEDVLDINHSLNVKVEIGRAEPRGKYVNTTKGSTNIDINVLNQVGHGKEVDFDLGNWLDEGNKKTTGATLCSHVEDGSASSYRTLNADSPTFRCGRWVKHFSPPPWLFLLVMRILKAMHLA